MAHRRKQSGAAEDIVKVASKLPWKVGVVLAIASYLVLHIIAGIVVEQPANMATVGSFAAKKFVVLAADIGQVILPVLLLFGTALSFFKQRKNEQRYEPIAATPSPVFAQHSAPQRETIDPNHEGPVVKEESPAPVCPQCNNVMVKRTAKQGANAGKEFWGCSQYPKCKNVVAITA